MRREVAKVIEPAFADRDDFGTVREICERLDGSVIDIARMMRMYSGRAAIPVRVNANQFDCRSSARKRAAGDEEMANARLLGAFDHRFTICIEAVVRQIESNVDERGVRVQ